MLGRTPLEYEDWKEGFYSSTDYETRRRYLEKAEGTESDETISWLDEILTHRYTVSKNGKAVDRFMGAWLEIRYLERTVKQILGVKRAKKAAETILDTLMLNREFPDWKAEYLSMEYEHLIRSYILICQNDRSYNSRVMNYIAMKPDALEKKLIDDINMKTITIPQRLELDKEFLPLADAARRIIEP